MYILSSHSLLRKHTPLRDGTAFAPRTIPGLSFAVQILYGACLILERLLSQRPLRFACVCVDFVFDPVANHHRALTIPTLPRSTIHSQLVLSLLSRA